MSALHVFAAGARRHKRHWRELTPSIPIRLRAPRAARRLARSLTVAARTTRRSSDELVCIRTIPTQLSTPAYETNHDAAAAAEEEGGGGAWA